jgi:2-haloalkanoic acid dehalogenase type II
LTDTITSVESFALKIPRDEPYLGPLEEGNIPNETGCFVRPRNKTIYSIYDHGVIVKVTTESGVVGWGECVAVVTPRTVTTIIDELLGPLVVGRDPHDVVAIYEDHYDAMRVRGFFGGFYHDAIAAIDIALWDVRGKLTDLPLSKLLGAQRTDRLPVYVSGLPGATREQRAALGKSWVEKGFTAVKFAAAVSDEGEEVEMIAVREAVGPQTQILVDLHWRSTIIREATRIGKERSIESDWVAFADAWRAGYGQAMNRVRQGELPWTKIDVLHRMILDDLVDEYGLSGLNEQELDDLNRVWHRLDPWSDSVGGLTRLKHNFTIATLSNGNVSLLSNMAKHAGLPWDVILSAEIVKHYKPDPESYLHSAELLSEPPERVMMVAAHKSDLKAAQSVGVEDCLCDATTRTRGGTRLGFSSRRLDGFLRGGFPRSGRSIGVLSTSSFPASRLGTRYTPDSSPCPVGDPGICIPRLEPRIRSGAGSGNENGPQGPGIQL